MKVFHAVLMTLLCAALLYLSSCTQQKLDKAEAEKVSQAKQIEKHQKAQLRHKHRDAQTSHSPIVQTRQVADMVISRSFMAMPSIAPRSYQTPELAENYLSITPSGVISTLDEAISTFSVDVDTAAYSNIRRMLVKEGRLPPKDAVRLEEMINYFDYGYSIPESQQQPFSVDVELAQAPWDETKHLLQIGLKGYEPAKFERPAANLVFLIDVSGSMQAPDKLNLVKKSLQMLVKQMNESDRVALVVYAGAAGVVLASTPGSKKAKIMRALDELRAGGSTNGGEGIELAYRIAAENFIASGINRVFIASDGDMNVGMTDLDQLKELVSKQRASGIALTTLGFGTGNYNDGLMEQLADVGNGQAAYIDTVMEAKKVLVDELQATLLTIARDVKIQIEFNPAQVAEYRLLGYENRALATEDFTNDKVDAGDIGAGHTVTAIYEISFTGSDNRRLPNRRYQEIETRNANDAISNELAFVKLRYKPANGSKSIEVSQPIDVPSEAQPLADASENLKFASAVASFGELMRGGKYLQDWNYTDVAQLARSAKGSDAHGYRAELISLVELADSLSFPEGS